MDKSNHAERLGREMPEKVDAKTNFSQSKQLPVGFSR
jgi:hypothetical protein